MGGNASRSSGFLRRLPILLICALTVTPAFAEGTGSSSFEILPDGTPYFTQILRWDGDQNALRYEVTFLTGGGDPVSEHRTDAPELTLHLPPGEYRYKIVFFNLLNKPEAETPWRELSVLRAEIPKMTGFSPSILYTDDPEPSIVVTGEDMIQGAKIGLKLIGDPAVTLTGTEIERNGTTEITAVFPGGIVRPGRYAVTVTNPGGISSTVGSTFLVRDKLSPVTGMKPVSGSTLGPDELRGTTFLKFSWNPVPEALTYEFRLCPAGHDVPLVREDALSSCEYVLNDLTLLDRGEYLWTVEPKAGDESGNSVLASGAARARFAVSFPMPAGIGPDLTDYYVTLLPDGTPREGKTVGWPVDPGVLRYEIALWTSRGEEVSFHRLEKPELTLRLAPGTYRYSVVLYNLLGKRETELPRQEFSVFKAETPVIAGCAPKGWFPEDPDRILSISGDDLMPGATVVLKRESSPAVEIRGTERGRSGTSSVMYEFSQDSVPEGEYSVELTNLGGISATVPHALLVRRKLPVPDGLKPAPGTEFGPVELRGMKSIRFDWTAVAGATRYVFRLYRGTESEPFIEKKDLTVPYFSIGSISVLDRGQFRWTVEAEADDPRIGVVPSVRPAEADFAIVLPAIRAPSLKTGDTFYGR